MFSINKHKTAKALEIEWDALASLRYRQIADGVDITFHHHLMPHILNLVANEDAKTIVDAGCGVGFLTRELALRGADVVGVDPSATSISLAKDRFGQFASFVQGTLEDYAENRTRAADVVVANMVLMNVLQLNKFLGAVHRSLRQKGAFIFSITHPCFWPSYYGYVNEPWFSYTNELVIEGPFRISSQPQCGLNSTHVHRPIESYITSLVESSLALEAIREPMPTTNVMDLYQRRWEFPRYIFGVCRKIV